MNLELLLNRSKAADFLIATVALIPAAVIYYGSFSPDAAIYFTFFKNFFQLPFSFAPETVSFGATSPLHVLIFAPVHAFLGNYWIPVAKLLNLLFVAFGMVLINRALRGGTKTILLIALLVAVSTALLAATAQLFETGLAFMFMAWLYHDLEHRRYERAALIAGSLYLVRPELLVVSVAVVAYIVVQTKADRRYLRYAGVSMALPLLYHIYMFAAGGTLLPASLFTPIITYIQDPASWLQRLGMTLSAFWSAQGLIYLAAALVALFLLTDGALSRYWREMLLCLPLVLLYLIFPPKDQILRYLVPVLPPLVAMIVRYVQQELKAQYTVRVLAISLLMAHGFGTAALSRMPQFDRDRLLLSDLSGELNRMAGPGDRVLLDQVQGQYYLQGPCISLTAAVGGEMLDVLLKRSTLKDFLAARQVKYIVLSANRQGESGAEETLLADFYDLDGSNITGDTVEIDGMLYTKVLSNVRGNRSDVEGVWIPATGYGEHKAGGPVPSSGAPLWSSVYAVLGPAPDVPARGLAAGHNYDWNAASPDPTVQPDDSSSLQPSVNQVDSVAVMPDSMAAQG